MAKSTAIMGSGQNALRKKFITDIVTNWINKNPDVFATWKIQKKIRMENNNSKFGELKGNQVDMIERIVWSMPAELLKQLDYGLENPQFCETREEEKWFVKNFPVFLATDNY